MLNGKNKLGYRAKSHRYNDSCNVLDKHAECFYPPNDAMIVGTSLTAMKRETLSMIPSKAEPKLRMSAGNSSPGKGAC